MYNTLRQWQYYIIIGIVSSISLFFLPMLGSSVGLSWDLPTTPAGWAVYISTKILVAIINILIFHCFIQQAKINVKNDRRYKEAKEILDEVKPESTERFRSPQEYFKGVYSTKGLTIFVTSILGAVGLTQAVLTFDLIEMLTYAFTVLMGVIFGVLQMNQTEVFWTEEYLGYAKQTSDELKKLMQCKGCVNSQTSKEEEPC